eukprot:m.293453 g.293453  ORF g.293453 m.293453 type:complete len:95 (-) comp55123_c0_seq3:56-340(-)
MKIARCAAMIFSPRRDWGGCACVSARPCSCLVLAIRCFLAPLFSFQALACASPFLCLTRLILFGAGHGNELWCLEFVVPVRRKAILKATSSRQV